MTEKMLNIAHEMQELANQMDLLASHVNDLENRQDVWCMATDIRTDAQNLILKAQMMQTICGG